MAIVVVQKKPSKEELETARQDYDTYIKITIDLNKKLIALGGEYHADAEALLLEQGGKQKDIWGGGLNKDYA